ncbi:hydroxyisourate hydrolase [Dyella sp.]|uniref:hydroxyisourate hydrolase n=1 Tax=Dyella sp. TaxID=1869338 RepID=UPI002ED211DB
MKGLARILLFSVLPLSAMAAENPLSVHVLDQQRGLPSADMKVRLERRDGESWKTLKEDRTDKDGRIRALAPGDALAVGIYRITFETGNWYAGRGQKTLFPEVPVVIEIDGSAQHYHVPLLLSPYGYSTYRGS